MARMNAEKADARDRAVSEINVELRRYSRRLKATAEDYIDQVWADTIQSGAPFDHRAVAQEALKQVEAEYNLALGA